MVVWAGRDDNLSRATTRYCIEVKTVEGMKDSKLCFREAFLQLIGLNAYNPYKSPAVILTNLVNLHYVLYLTLESNVVGDPLKYKLNIHHFSAFAHALWFAEVHLGDREPCCMDLFREATPEATARLQREETSDGAEEGDDHYDNVVLDTGNCGK